MASAITKKNQESIYDQLNKRVKSLLSEEITAVSPFAKELYKKVRNNVKKLEDIRTVEEKIKAGNSKIDEAQAEKLRNKDSYIQSVQLSLETFDIYKKTELVQRQAEVEAAKQAAQQALIEAEAPVTKEESKVSNLPTEVAATTQTTSIQGQENKVVECSILQTPPQTETKQVQATPVVEAPQEVTKQVKLLVRDHTTTIEEALRLIAPVFLILPNVFSMMGTNPVFREHSHLSESDIIFLQQFFFSVALNVQDLTVEAKLKRAQEELMKVVLSGEPDKPEESSIYGKVRRLLNEGIIKNKDVLSLNPTFPMVNQHLLLQGVPMVSGFPGAQAYSQVPLNLQPQFLAQSQRTVVHQQQ